MLWSYELLNIDMNCWTLIWTVEHWQVRESYSSDYFLTYLPNSRITRVCQNPQKSRQSWWCFREQSMHAQSKKVEGWGYLGQGRVFFSGGEWGGDTGHGQSFTPFRGYSPIIFFPPQWPSSPPPNFFCVLRALIVPKTIIISNFFQFSNYLFS